MANKKSKSASLGSKIFILLVILVIIMLFYKFDLGHYFTLEYIKEQKENFRTFYQDHMLSTILAYVGIYVLSTALSLPGATILTLAGGAIFGVVLGTVLVSIASTVGAALAFLVARFILRDSVQAKFGDKLKAINAGIQREGAFYLFTLRLLPIFPFFLVNILMALTPMSIGRYFFVSQIGMLPGTIVYVNAGTQIANLESTKGILSPELIMSFVLLGVFPIIAKKLLALYQHRKVYKHFTKPKNFEYNVVVIGAGAAGLISAYIAAAVKAKVALIEKNEMGGDCLNTGCVPSKALIHSAKVASLTRRAESLGYKSINVDFTWADIMARVHRVIKKIAPHDSIARYTQLGVDCIQGTATIISPWEVKVGDRVLTTKNIIIAAGGAPIIPKFPGLDQVKYHTTETIWELKEKPKSMLVLGGGPIGCELAQCFQRLGVNVTIVEKADRLLSKEDKDISDVVAKRLKDEGIRILTSHTAREFADHQLLVEKAGGGTEKIGFDTVLFALGRQARIVGYGLEKLGVEIAPTKTIAVNEFLQTTKYPNIYVCGDAIAPYQFTHVAGHEAWFCAVNALFSPLKRFKVSYNVIPWATFTDPEVARVGLSEDEANAKGIDYELTVYHLNDFDRAIADEEDHGIVKILTVPGKDKILGAAIVGAHAGELIIEFICAMKHGFGLNKILSTIHIYPTWVECNKLAAGQWKKAHTPHHLLKYVAAWHNFRRRV